MWRSPIDPASLKCYGDGEKTHLHNSSDLRRHLVDDGVIRGDSRHAVAALLKFADDKYRGFLAGREENLSQLAAR